METKRSLRIRVNFDPELGAAVRLAAASSSCTVSALIYNIVAKELRQSRADPDRTKAALEYLTIQLDVLLTHTNPQLKIKARDVFKAKVLGSAGATVEAGDAL